MMEFSRCLSRRVFDDGICAYENPCHPCHPFVRWQQSYAKENGGPELTFQLPEPLSGQQSSLNLVFVGLNPGFDPWEEFPSPADSFEDYDSFFRCRFDDEHRNAAGQPVVFGRNIYNERTSRSPRFWRGIERLGDRHLSGLLGGSFTLGRDAIITQVVRYKSKKAWKGNNRQERDKIREHEDCMTRCLLDDLKPDVAVPCGVGPMRALARILAVPQLKKGRLGQLIGSAYWAELPCGKVMKICPLWHLSYSARNAQWDENAAIAIRTALGLVAGS
jgi:hypothetical protein